MKETELQKMFSDEDLQQARNVSLSALISKSIKLSRAGREFKACCPFHKENNPSFTINDEKGFYHCFGCGAHGDAIKWLTDYAGVGFKEAVEILIGRSVQVKGPAPAQREKAFNEPEFVDSFVVAQHIWSIVTPFEGTLADTYLQNRGFNTIGLAAYLENAWFVPNCPLHAWEITKGPDSAKTAPALIWPIHRYEKSWHGPVVRFIGVHATYLGPDGNKLIRTARDGTALPSRKIFGSNQGGAVLLTSMDGRWPLLNGEGVETTLGGLSLMLRQWPMVRLAASLSLNNHQGYAVKDDDGAIPLYAPRYDRQRNAFVCPNPGEVWSMIDADMKPHAIKVRRQRGEPVEVGITSEERTKLCSELLRQKWMHFGAKAHFAFEPPKGMDYADAWNSSTAESN